MLARRFATGVLLLALGVSGTAGAATGEGNVTVSFGLTFALESPSVLPPWSTAVACQLSAASGALAVDVLDAAVAQRCIEGYGVYGSGMTPPASIRCIQIAGPPCLEGEALTVCYPSPAVCAGYIGAESWWSHPSFSSFRASSGSEFVAKYNGRLIND